MTLACLGVSLAAYARVSAALGDGAPLDEALARAGLSPGAWPWIDDAFAALCTARPDAAHAFRAALEAAQLEAARAVPPYDVEPGAYGALLAALAEGPDQDEVLARANLGPGDLARLRRRWSGREPEPTPGPLARAEPRAEPRVAAPAPFSDFDQEKGTVPAMGPPPVTPLPFVGDPPTRPTRPVAGPGLPFPPKAPAPWVDATQEGASPLKPALPFREGPAVLPEAPPRPAPRRQDDDDPLGSTMAVSSAPALPVLPFPGGRPARPAPPPRVSRKDDDDPLGSTMTGSAPAAKGAPLPFRGAAPAPPPAPSSQRGGGLPFAGPAGPPPPLRAAPTLPAGSSISSTLPIEDSSRPPAPRGGGLPGELSPEQYGRLCAELHAFPQTPPLDVARRHGLSSEALLRACHASLQARLKASPADYAKYQAAYWARRGELGVR